MGVIPIIYDGEREGNMIANITKSGSNCSERHSAVPHTFCCEKFHSTETAVKAVF